MSVKNNCFKYSKLYTALLSITVVSGFGYTNIAQASDLTGYLDNYDSTIFIGVGDADEGLKMDGGYIDGGTIQSDADSANLFDMANASGTLESVTVNGSLDITGDYAVASIRRGLTVNDADGDSEGVINITGNGSQLRFDSDLTLDNVTINLGSLETSSIVGEDNAKLTLGESSWLLINDNAEVNATRLVNLGYMDVESGTTSINGEFINESLVNAEAGTTLNINDLSSANYGDIYGDGATINFNGSNYGSIHTTDGTLNLNGGWNEPDSYINTYDTNLGLGGHFVASDTDLINRVGGNVTLLGQLDNTDNTLDIGEYSFFSGLKVVGGTILGGVVQSDSQPINLFSETDNTGTLDGVTIDGTLNIKGANAHVKVVNGISVTQSINDIPNMIRVTGDNAVLDFVGSQTVDSTIIKVGSNTEAGSKISQRDGELILGENLLVETNAIAHIEGENIVNQGNITVNTGELNVAGFDFTNDGNITLNEGTSLYQTTKYMVNNGIITLGTDTYLAEMDNDFYNAGTIDLRGGFLDIYSTDLNPKEFINDGTISGNGVISVDNFSTDTTFGHRQLVNNGVISPNSYGGYNLNLQILSDFNQTETGLLSFDFGQANEFRDSAFYFSSGFVNIFGSVSFGGKLEFDNLGSLAVGDLVTLVTFSGDYLGGVFDFSGSVVGDIAYKLIYENHSIALQVSAAPVPVPAAAWLFASAMVGFVGYNRRKQAQA